LMWHYYSDGIVGRRLFSWKHCVVVEVMPSCGTLMMVMVFRWRCWADVVTCCCLIISSIDAVLWWWRWLSGMAHSQAPGRHNILRVPTIIPWLTDLSDDSCCGRWWSGEPLLCGGLWNLQVGDLGSIGELIPIGDVGVTSVVGIQASRDVAVVMEPWCIVLMCDHIGSMTLCIDRGVCAAFVAVTILRGCYSVKRHCCLIILYWWWYCWRCWNCRYCCCWYCCAIACVHWLMRLLVTTYCCCSNHWWLVIVVISAYQRSVRKYQGLWHLACGKYI